MKTFIVTDGNLRLRSCNECLIDAELHSTAEISQRMGGDAVDSRPFYLVLAYWKKDSEGDFCLRFVGDRPLDKAIIPERFWQLVIAGYTLLKSEEGNADA